MLASGGEDGMVKLWDNDDGERLRTLSGHASRAAAMAWSPNGETVAAGDQALILKRGGGVEAPAVIFRRIELYACQQRLRRLILCIGRSRRRGPKIGSRMFRDWFRTNSKEILKAGFRIATSAVVLLTPDDEARVREGFRQEDDPEYERTLSPQPRPNVLFEAGMAMAHFPRRTVLVQVGWSQPFIDIAGNHSIKIDNTLEKRRDLAGPLKMAGCEWALGA